MTSTPAARAFLIFAASIVGTAVLLVFLTISSVGNTQRSVDQSRENTVKLEESTQLAEDNATILRIILAVTGCTVEDTPAQCRERIAETNAIRDEREIAEIECRFRLALDKRPSPAPGTSCIPAKESQ